MGEPMANPKLSTVTRTQGNNQAVKDGSVMPATANLVFEEVPVLVDAFRRMVQGLEFDVCEMAFTTYLCAKAHGKPFTALPVFLVRGFHHGAILVNTEAGIARATDLEGRRVGVHRGYTVTTGVWARGILQDELGVDLDRVTWVVSGDEHVAEYRPPANVVPMAPGAALADLVGTGELAAVVGADVDRPTVAPLFDDPVEAGYAAFRQRGLYPINHLLVVKDDLLHAYPDLGADLFDTFARAKRRYVERLGAGDIADPTATDLMYRQVMDMTGEDPLPYGVEPNRLMIELLVDHAVRQRILEHALAVEDLFAEGTQQLVG